MHTYFTSQIIVIDAFLALSVAGLAILIIVYVAIMEGSARIRNNGLVNIKKNVYKFLLSGTKFSDNTCAPFAGNSTPQQILDVAMNRDTVFFNKREQDAFRACYKVPEKLKIIESKALKARNKWRRIEALLSLSYLNDDNAPAIFNTAVKSKDEDIRYFSLIALAQMRNGQSAKILTGLLKNNNFSRRKIVSILENFPPDITSNYTIPLLKDRDKDVRFWALKLLSRLEPGKHLSLISALFRDHSEDVRSAVCECLGNSKDKAAADTLSLALKDGSWLVRSSAVKAFSQLLGSDSIPKVIGLLGDSSLSVLSAVKDVLAAHIDTAMPYIEKITAGDDRMAKLVCIEAIEEARKGKPR